MTSPSRPTDRWKAVVHVGAHRVFPWAVILLLWLLILSVVPHNRPVIFDSSEGVAGWRGLMCHEGYRVFRDFWSDQPPLCYIFLGWWYHMVEPGLWSGRYLVWLFSGIFLFAFYRVVAVRADRFAGLLSVMAIYSSSSFISLSFSLLEVIPAWAVTLCAVALLGPPGRTGSVLFTGASGVLFAFSAAMHLTVCLLLPAILVEMWAYRSSDVRTTAVKSMVWGGTFFISFAIMAMAWPFDVSSMLSVLHPSVHDQALPTGRSGPNHILFFLLSEMPILILLFPVAVMLRQKRLRAGLLPLVWSVSVLLFLHWCSPVRWRYEFLLALPLACLAGISCSNWLEHNAANSQLHAGAPNPLRLAIMVLFAVIAIPARLVSSAGVLDSPVFIMDQKILSACRELKAKGTKAATSRYHAYFMEAGLINPPECDSRSVIGSMNAVISRRNPDALLLHRDDLKSLILEALPPDYIPEPVTQSVVMFKRSMVERTPADLENFLIRSVMLTPYDYDAQAELAGLLAGRGRELEAASRYRLTIRRSAAGPDRIMELGLLLANASDVRVRNCPEAIRLAGYAVDLSNHRQDLVEKQKLIWQRCAGGPLR